MGTQRLLESQEQCSNPPCHFLKNGKEDIGSQFNTVWTVDFKMPVFKLYLLFISADAAQDKEKEKKVLLPTDVSKSTVHTIIRQHGLSNYLRCAYQ
jgi:hypothetical protein